MCLLYSHQVVCLAVLKSEAQGKKNNNGIGNSFGGSICSSNLQKNMHTLDTGTVQDGLEVVHLLQKGCSGRNNLLLWLGRDKKQHQ